MKFEMPAFLVEILNSQYGEERVKEIIQGFSVDRKVTFRVNTLKTSSYEVEEILKKSKIEYEKVGWSEEAFILNNVKEKDIEELDIYKNGEIYLQSLSSMLPPIILNPKENADILDMASAPGGKTTQMAAISNNKAHITACEINSIRAERLKYNIEKQGASCVYVMQKDSRTIEININKNFIDKISKTQFNLLKKAIKILKPGAEMVYSTCSILYEENEKNIEKILKDYNVQIVPIEFQGIEELPILPTKIKGTLLLAPNELYEGFFVAKIKKVK